VRAGFRDGRSPDVIAVTRRAGAVGGTAVASGSSPRGLSRAPAWPSEAAARGIVPVVFAGRGVSPDAALQRSMALDDIAPTLAAIIGLDRAHPEVRSGRTAPGVASGVAPRAALEVVWDGPDAAALRARPRAWPFLRSLMERGAATMRADVGSLPLDPAAVTTTIGSGGLPFQHGITGTELRNDHGRLVRAWGDRAPISVIAALGDDLDSRVHERPHIGLVAPSRFDRGLIGGNWYLHTDRDDVVFGAPDPVASARRILRRGYGADAVPDLLGVVLRGRIRLLDRRLRALTRAARRAAGGSLAVIVTTTGSRSGGARRAESALGVVRRLDRRVAAPGHVVEGAAAGGLFLDQHALAASSIAEDDVVRALQDMRAPSGRPLFADAFGAVAVSFARYC
jgi:hypothetical protein